VTRFENALEAGIVGGRLWFYSNYHCNLACVYCLTESSPAARRRLFDRGSMLRLAEQALAKGFTSFGVTGGEPFLRPDIVDVLLDLAALRPVLVLSNATVFRGRVLDEMKRLVGRPVTIQMSLDGATPDHNDEMRGPENFARVIEAIPHLVEMGIPVRIATTGEERDPADAAALCALHRSFGISDEHHILRPIVNRGRAATNGLGVFATAADLPPELTLTVDGAFWSPFGPTVQNGRLDLDLLLTRTTNPLDVPLDAMLRVAGCRPSGSESRLTIR